VKNEIKRSGVWGFSAGGMLALSLITQGCNVGRQDGAQEVTRERVTLTSVARSAKWQQLQACRAVDERLQVLALERYREALLREKERVMSSRSDSTTDGFAMSAPALSAGGAAYVEPKNRVEGVDEGDLIKWDEQSLFRLTRQFLHRVKVTSSESAPSGILESVALPYGSHQIVFNRQVKQLAVLSELWEPTSSGGSSSTTTQSLNSGSSSSPSAPAQEILPLPSQARRTGGVELRFYEVTETKLTQRGATRKLSSIADGMRMGLRSYLTPTGQWRVLVRHSIRPTTSSRLKYYPEEPHRRKDPKAWEEIFEQGKAVIARSFLGTGASLIWQDSGANSERSGGSETCRLTFYDGELASDGVTALTVWDAQSGASLDQVAVLANDPTLLLQANQIALGETQYFPFFLDKKPRETNLHLLKVSPEGKFTLDAHGTLAGTIGKFGGTTDQDSQSWLDFSHEGYLRAVVSNGDGTRIVILKGQEGQLVEVGKTPVFGLGESVMGVQFKQDLAFVVTYLRTDPLHVIDLKDPSAPRLRGELVVPGYSSSLLEVGEGLFLGVGSTGNEGPATERNKVKASLYQLTDLDHPLEVASVTLDDSRWSWEYDHSQRLAYSPEHRTLAFPYMRANMQGDVAIARIKVEGLALGVREGQAVGLRVLPSIVAQPGNTLVRASWVAGRLSVSTHQGVSWLAEGNADPSSLTTLNFTPDTLPADLTLEYGWCGVGN
jgi:hypothetical protein